MPATLPDTASGRFRRFLSGDRARYNVLVPDASEKIAELRREVAANPTSRQFYQLGELLRRAGECHEAAAVLTAGLAHNPRYVAAWVSLGRAQLECGAGREAARALHEALELDRQNPVAWRLLGEANLAAGDRDQALTAFDRALELVPGDKTLRAVVKELADALTGPAPVEPPRERRPDPAPFSFAFESPLEGPGDVFGALAPPAPPVYVGTGGLPDDLFDLGEGGDEPLWSHAPVDAPFAWAAAEPAPEVSPAPVWREGEQADGGTAAGEEGAEAQGGPAPGAPPAAAEDVAWREADVAPQAEEEPEAVELPPVEPEIAPAVAVAPEVVGGPEILDEVPDGAVEAARETIPVEGEADAARTGPIAEEALSASAAPFADVVAEAARPAGPPATITLARLYIQQQQLDLAADTLERLTASEPANQEARDLLELVRDMMEPLPGGLPVLSARERKIAALQRWLASLTLSHERTTR